MAKDFEGSDDEDVSTKLPTRIELGDLLNKTSKIDAEMAELRGAKGAAIQTAEEDIGINRKAFKLVCQLEKMDKTKRAEFFAHFDHYVENRDLRDQNQGNLFDVPDQDDGGPTDGAFT